MLCIDKDLVPHTTPEYTILRFQQKVFQLEFPDNVTTVRLLPAIEDLTLNTSTGDAVLTWSPVAFPVQVWRREFAVSVSYVLVTTLAANTDAYTDTVWSLGNEAQWYLIAEGENGNSLASNVVRVGPDAPIISSLTVVGATANITWPALQVPSVLFRQDLTLGTPAQLASSAPANSIGYADTAWNSSNETIWWREVVGQGGPNSPRSNYVLANPSAVDDLSLNAYDATTASLSWSAIQGAIYQVWRISYHLTGVPVLIGTAFSGNFIDPDFDVLNGDYEWYVVKSNGSQFSSNSNSVFYSPS